MASEVQTSTPASGAVKRDKKPNLRYLRDKDRQMVRGKFHFHEVPGGVLKFNVRLHKDDPVETFELYDGQIYTLPLGVARHLNKNVAYPEHAYLEGESVIGGVNPNGLPMRVKRMVRRCSFESLEFLDEEGLKPDVGLSTVETNL